MPISRQSMLRARFLFWLDCWLLVAFAPLQTPRTTSLAGHEWLGVAFAAVIAVHLLVNWQWITATLRRIMVPGSSRARVNTLLNGALFICMALTVLSGLAISEVLLPPIGLRPSDLQAWRQIHSLLAAMSVVIVGIHLGLNWDWISGVVRARLPIAGTDKTSSPVVLEPNEVGGLEVQGREASSSVVKMLGVRDFKSALRRLAVLAAVVSELWLCCFAVIELTATATIRPVVSLTEPTATGPHNERQPRPRIWPTAELTDLPREAGLQLLIIAASAVLAKKVARLRL